MSNFSQGDKVKVHMPGQPLHEMRGTLEDKPGDKVAAVHLSNGEVRLLPKNMLRKVPGKA